jgi:hypothetical protein
VDPRRISIVLVLALGGACTSLDGLTNGSSTDAGIDAPTDDAGPGDAGSDVLPFDAGASYVFAVLLDSPIAYYRLGDNAGTAVDLGSAHANGIYGPGVAKGVPSLLSNDTDTAALFSAGGTPDSIVRVSENVALEPKAALTVECWVHLTAAPAGGPSTARLVSYGEDEMAPYEAYVLQVQSGKPELYIGALALTVTGGTPLTQDRTYHLAGTFDGNTARIYVNGNSEGVRPSGGAIGPYDIKNGLGIGGGFGGGGSQLRGTLDEIAIYDHALSADRIAAHYAAGR